VEPGVELAEKPESIPLVPQLPDDPRRVVSPPGASKFRHGGPYDEIAAANKRDGSTAASVPEPGKFFPPPYSMLTLQGTFERAVLHPETTHEATFAEKSAGRAWFAFHRGTVTQSGLSIEVCGELWAERHRFFDLMPTSDRSTREPQCYPFAILDYLDGVAPFTGSSTTKPTRIRLVNAALHFSKRFAEVAGMLVVLDARLTGGMV